ncbi:hypothetical protein [Halalkalibacter lacteus]|uniref:hypothetical protein n=1 Tax=Halalkalibacter lacteus TaxID=3090663 RepID=UPI002FCB63C0
MKKTPGENIIVSKPALRYVIRALPNKNFKIFWNHLEHYSILNIRDHKSKQMSKATFTNGENLAFQHLESTDPKVISVFEKVLGITLDKNQNKSYKTLYLEIDYHLLELHEYIEANDRVKIKETKAKLAFLSEKIINLQSNKEPCDDGVSIN